jgi:MFS superfamily sulfate permease-like transporter
MRRETNLKADIVSGMVIFLIALPLSIGIALAAGAPASAGILAAILGGILGTFFTGAHVVINGPAAGLIVVVLGAVQSLGGDDPVLGFKRTLAVVIVAGFLQVVLGLFRMGRLAFLAPSSVVHGMLSAIGVIIIIKQIPVLFGAAAHAETIIGMVGEIPQYVAGAQLPIALTGLSCLGLMILWNRFGGKLKKILPAPLLSVALGLISAGLFNLSSEHSMHWFDKVFQVGPRFLVNVPVNFSEMFIFPSFDIIFSFKSIIATFSIFVVCSIESLLSTYAVDKLDPLGRKSDLDKDILGKGVINIACGCLGAYPIISEIVRSSANIENGAQTKWSNFFHGLFILIFVALFPSFLNKIPLSALAAVLLLVGFNLAHPKHFVEVYHHGLDQFFLFSLTLTVTLVEDLLVGIAVGIAAKIFIHWMRGVRFKQFFNPDIDVVEEGDGVIVRFHSPAVFLSYLNVQKKLSAIDSRQVSVDYNGSFVDFTIRELVKDTIPESVFS